MKLYLISLECYPIELSCWHATPKITRIRASPLNVSKFESSRKKRRWTWSTHIKDIGARHDRRTVRLKTFFFEHVQREEPRLRRNRETPARPGRSTRSRCESASDDVATREGTMWTWTFCAKDRMRRLSSNFLLWGIRENWATSERLLCLQMKCTEMQRDERGLLFKSIKSYQKSADGKVVWVVRWQWQNVMFCENFVALHQYLYVMFYEGRRIYPFAKQIKTYKFLNIRLRQKQCTSNFFLNEHKKNKWERRSFRVIAPEQQTKKRNIKYNRRDQFDHYFSTRRNAMF